MHLATSLLGKFLSNYGNIYVFTCWSFTWCVAVKGVNEVSKTTDIWLAKTAW